jgi:hypothetical protein
MGDSSKLKTHSSAHGANNSSLALGTQAFSPRADLVLQLSASAGPVTSRKKAHSWLEKKGWILASEQYLKSKLTKILFLVALMFKLPTEADSALHSVAFLICNLGDEDLASMISVKLIDKIANSLSELIDKLTDSIAVANNFLHAM